MEIRSVQNHEENQIYACGNNDIGIDSLKIASVDKKRDIK